jgi:hydrogenase maturation protein HypF
MGLAALHVAGMSYRIGGWLKQHYPEREGAPLITMLDRNLRCPPTSSLGRWFDAAAGLLGVREMAHYEGQAAMELEGLAAAYGAVAPLKNGFLLHDGQLDLTPLIPALLVCHDKAEGAALFHATVAAGLAAWALAAVNGEKQQKIAIAGGCAMNVVLTDALRQHLANAGVELLEARQAPPNDGGLALGQAWVARQQIRIVQ